MELKNFYYPGRMISVTKTAPKGHICVFNGNICVKSKGKIWFGDIDITADKEKLIELAKEWDEPIYILKEMDARFQNESNPKYERAKAIIYPDGLVDIPEE